MDERAEFASFMVHMEKGLKREAPTLTREEMLAVVAFSLWQENRRTAPDREAIVRAGEDVVVTNVPDRIYLNLGDIYEMGELPFQQLTDVTWCEDRIDDTDIEYVRAAAPTSDKGGA